MEITSIAGFAVITQNAQQSAKLYKDDLGLPLQGEDEYLAMDRFPGTNHFGIWPLHLAAESCFGTGDWPDDVPVPSSTIEYELASVSALTSAVIEMEAKGYTFVHGAREEPWGQTVARLLSPENVLIGFSYSPWLHK